MFFDFEPPGDRRMLMSYIMIGRDPAAAEEVIALYTSRRDWHVLARGPVGTPRHEEVMVENVVFQVAELDVEMARLIERLD